MAENDDQDLMKQISELEIQHAVLEEKMNTKQAETETALERMNASFERLRTDMADWKTDMAQRDTDLAQRDTHLVRTIYGAAALAAILMGAVIVLLEQLA